MTAADPFVVTDTERLSTWGSAVQATYYAIEAQTRAAWRIAAQWWDALASLHSPVECDREIYRKLAVDAWLKASDRRLTK